MTDERYEKLSEELDAALLAVNIAASDIKRLEAENARYRKALEKYANPETHSADENGFVWSGDFFDYKTARDALEGKE